MPRPLSPPRARTPLHDWHEANGARFMHRDGWQFPASYASVEKEAAAFRTGLGLADVSAFAKISLLGPGVPALVQALLGDSPAAKPLGVGTFDAGGPVFASRLTEEHLLLLSSATTTTGLDERLANLVRGQPLLQSDATSAYAGFCLAGPRTEDLLRRLTHLDVTRDLLAEGTCAETGLAGVPALLVRPPGLPYPAMYLYVSWDLGEYVWEQCLHAGHGFGLMPVGLNALGV